ncbi:hypothetical protein [Planctomicrobium sp. SH664]|uniref:hypothetical protein n=1 Tax=Planctomicrobium sp. SH664 TaxID=3448125 RepID=UPI003F5C9954
MNAEWMLLAVVTLTLGLLAAVWRILRPQSRSAEAMTAVAGAYFLGVGLLHFGNSGWGPFSSDLAATANLLAESSAATPWGLLTAAWGAILLLAWPGKQGSRWQAPAILVALGCLQLAILSKNPWLQWGAVSLGGWACGLSLSGDGASSDRDRRPQIPLLWLTAADLLWLLGLLNLGDVAGSPMLAVSELAGGEFLSSLAPAQLGRVTLGSLLFLASIAIRAALFPLMGWTRSVTFEGRDVALLVMGAFFPAWVLMWRWGELWFLLPEIQLIVVNLGVLGSGLLALSALSETSPPRRLMRLAGAQGGLIFAAFGAGIGSEGLTLLLGSGLLLMLIPQLFEMPIGRARTVALFASGGLLCCGWLGQEGLYQALTARTDGIPPLAGLGPLLLPVLQCVLTYPLFRSIREVESVSGVLVLDSAEQRRTPLQLGFALVTWLCVIGVTVQLRRLGLLSAGWIPLFMGQAALAGVIGAYSLPLHPTDSPRPAGRFAGLQRLAREDFYTLPIINLLVLPLRMLAQLSRFSEWIVIERITTKLPRGIVRAIADEATALDEESGVRKSTQHILTATLILCVTAAAILWK